MKIVEKIKKFDDLVGPNHGLNEEQMESIGLHLLTLDKKTIKTEIKKFAVDSVFMNLLPTPTQLVDLISEDLIKKSPNKPHKVAKVINRACKLDPIVLTNSVIIGKINETEYKDIDGSEVVEKIVFGTSEDVYNAKDVTETDEKSDSK